MPGAVAKVTAKFDGGTAEVHVEEIVKMVKLRGRGGSREGDPGRGIQEKTESFSLIPGRLS